MSNAAFKLKVAAFAKKVEQNSEQAARIAALALLRSVVLMSPVDTGRFRGNWFAQFDAAPQTTMEVDRGGGMTIERAMTYLKGFKLGMPKIFLLNHLPYSIPLEYGHSQQAPHGMVRLTVVKFRQFMREVADEINK